MTKIQQQRSVACFKRWNREGFSAFRSLGRVVMIGVLSVSMSIITLAEGRAQQIAADSTATIGNVELEGVGVVTSKESPTRSAFTQTPIYNRRDESIAPLQTLESALRLSPSVDVRERGGKGVQSDISIRGGSFDQTMMLLNGINFTDARTGHQTHSLPIDIESIAGIELIEGISGVGAYAGAINVRTAPLHANYLKIDGAAGAHGYGYGSLSGATTIGRLSLYGAGSYRQSNGYIYNTDFENWNGYLRAKYDHERWGLLDAQVGYQKRDFGANGFYSLSFPDQFEATETALASLRYLKEFGQFKLNSSISYRKNFDRFELIKGDTSKVPYNYHDTDNIGAELWGDYTWNAGTTTLGADYSYNHIWSNKLGKEAAVPHGRYTYEDQRNIGNFYLRHNKNWDKISASASAGISATPYGNKPLWSAMVKYRPIEGMSIDLGANESMRLPTFNDLYYNSPTNVANENLVPEQAITYSVKGTYRRSQWSTGFDVYYRDGKNIIDWTMAPTEDKWYSRQITELGTFGAEWRGDYTFGGIIHRLAASYGYIDQTKDSGDMVSQYAMNYMHNKATMSLDLRPVEKLSLIVTASLYDRYGNYANGAGKSAAYEPYTLIDARLAWSEPKWSAYIDCTNITSTEYFDYGGLMMPKAWLVAGASFTIF